MIKLQKRAFIRTLLAAACACAFAGAAQAENVKLKVGVTPGSHALVMELVKPLAAKEGIDLQVIEFNDYVQPNAALAAGDLDLNSMQHKPYLDQQIKDRGYKFAIVGATLTEPIGIYSKKVKSLAELKEGARFGIPSDPSNGGRVLLLLQEKGLIKIKPGTGLTPSPLDVVDNPKKLKFVELDAPQLPRSLPDLDAAGINTNFALEAGLNPKTDAITQEGPNGPYANILVVREEDQSKPWVAKLLKAYQNDTIRKYIDEKFKGAVIPSF